MIVNTLKMCTGDAGPEQSLVLFFEEVVPLLGAMSDKLVLFLSVVGIRT